MESRRSRADHSLRISQLRLSARLFLRLARGCPLPQLRQESSQKEGSHRRLCSSPSQRRELGGRGSARLGGRPSPQSSSPAEGKEATTYLWGQGQAQLGQNGSGIVQLGEGGNHRCSFGEGYQASAVEGGQFGLVEAQEDTRFRAKARADGEEEVWRGRRLDGAAAQTHELSLAGNGLSSLLLLPARGS